ncbi:Uma2 family endonuclease [Alienimonas californiensis]|uniref:Putative restriction endonuclease domain-containing protein n=1 Tax=Alienimonas californiensis TaxID=2527989 RepID=A0A517P8G7_9PLAN|nr:Uma2 family endonuclease [Alienimonas californiensis]QDT15669.1 hypothetical protein CA12_17590 [Alienimonas californiensis]
MSAALAPSPAAESAETEPARPAEPRLLMTRAEFEAADACPGTRVEWLGVTGETRDGEPLGHVRPRFGFNPDGSYAMANRQHSTLVTNLIALLLGAVDRDVWEVFTQDAEVGCLTGRHRFPDVVLTRLPARYADHPRDREFVLLNPSVCIEVLSEGTEAVDLRDKPGDYLSIPSVTDYLVVAQDEPNVLHHRRAAGGAMNDEPAAWAVERIADLAATVTLTAPAATLPLAEIYKRVFPA